MKCKFVETEECPISKLFDRWKDNKKETAWLMLGECLECSIYRNDVNELIMVKKEDKGGSQ
jgi:hypothetical protein